MMDRIEEKLLRYPDLSAEERAAVDAYVEAHPELAGLREEVLRLYDLFAEARTLERDPLSDEALAYYALTQYLAGQPAALELSEVNERLKQRIEASPEARARLDAMDRRLRELEAGVDVGAHFERLTGRQIRPSAEDQGSRVREQEAPAWGGAKRLHTLPASDREKDSRANRPPARIYSLRAMRYAAAAVVVVALGYVALWGASEATEPEWADLAAISSEEFSVEGYDLRLRGPGAEPDSASPHLRYLRALDLLERARTTTLGLFPRYDDAALRRASELLREVIRDESENSFLQLESYYFLGKAQLALAESQAAAEAFQAVVARGGRKAEEASIILREISD